MNENGQKSGNEVNSTIPVSLHEDGIKAPNRSQMSECLDTSVLDRQVRMMSDSLAACKLMSSYRSTVKKENCVGAQTTVRPNVLPQTPIEILLPPEERTLEYLSQNQIKNLVVSYVARDEPKFELPPEDGSLSDGSGGVVFKDGSGWSWKASVIHYDGGSKVGMYRYEEVDPGKMMEVIQRELKALLEMAPTAGLIVSGLSDSFFHYKECIRCKEKIRPALPWILNRIQKLRKYITTKNHGTYQWPNDYSYVRLPPKKSIEENPSTIVQAEEHKTQIGKLERVDASAVFDDRPGVQILLDVKPVKGKKRFFEKFKTQKISRRTVGTFPTFCLRELSCDPLIQILLPTPEVPVAWHFKQEITEAKGFAVAVPTVVLTPSPKVVETESVSTPAATAIAVQTAKSQIYPKPVQFYEERAFKVIQNPLTILLRQIPKKKEPEKKLRARDFRARASGLVRELLDEAEEEKMQVREVKKLESEVKGLKDLMLEVHKNQVELSKVLLEKGVCSTPIIKLIDPNMLEEESQVVRRAAEVEVPGTRTSSVEALQLMVDDLKRKCDVKNRMLVTLLKGLRSDVPKEWWEELVDYIFDESKPVEAFDPEKVGEFVQQTWMFLSGEEKASSARSRYEEQPSEDESQMKGVTGEEVDDAPDIGEKDGVGILPDGETYTKMASRKWESQKPENDSLWQQIEQLKETLIESVTEVMSKGSNRRPLPQDVVKTSGRTINLTIQITEKDSRHVDISASRAQNLTEDVSPRLFLKLVDERYLSKSNRTRLENDVNFLDKAIPSIASSKVSSYLESKTSLRPSSETSSKPVVLASSRHSSRPGPSSALEKPSVMELVEKQNHGSPVLMANERELHTIPENDYADSISSARNNQAGAVQRLRTRLKSMHNDLEVLKSKNDRMDGLN